MKFLIHVSTDWCGMDQTYRAEADSEIDLLDIAEQLAYENFLDYSCQDYVAEEYGYDPEDMTEEDWDELWNSANEADYYSYSIEKFEEDDKDWEDYGGIIYGKQ